MNEISSPEARLPGTPKASGTPRRGSSRATAASLDRVTNSLKDVCALMEQVSNAQSQPAPSAEAQPDVEQLQRLIANLRTSLASKEKLIESQKSEIAALRRRVSMLEAR